MQNEQCSNFHQGGKVHSLKCILSLTEQRRRTPVSGSPIFFPHSPEFFFRLYVELNQLNGLCRISVY